MMVNSEYLNYTSWTWVKDSNGHATLHVGLKFDGDGGPAGVCISRIDGLKVWGFVPEPVRCKDCELFSRDEPQGCTLFDAGLTDEKGYCAWGARKVDES